MLHLLQLKAAIEQLEKEHDLLLKKKEEYARTARILALKLERANNIMEGLNSEKKRWNDKFLVSIFYLSLLIVSFLFFLLLFDSLDILFCKCICIFSSYLLQKISCNYSIAGGVYYVYA